MKNEAKYTVAVLEDDENEANILKNHINTYKNENNILIEIDIYSNPIFFFNNPKPIYDIVFMDIEMPQMDGLSAAKRLRQMDEKAVLIFISNLGQYAIRGYEVNAMDFVLKPISYSSFVIRMKRALNYINEKKDNYVMIPLPYGMMRMVVLDIFFIEVRGHKLFFNTRRGIIETRGKLSEYETSLEIYGFLRCSKCAIVNLNLIESIDGSEIKVNNCVLQISRNRRKEFSGIIRNNTIGKVYSGHDELPGNGFVNRN